MFIVQVKRIHEYKRQLLTCLQIWGLTPVTVDLGLLESEHER